jgi:hypothetical protein
MVAPTNGRKSSAKLEGDVIPEDRITAENAIVVPIPTVIIAVFGIRVAAAKNKIRRKPIPFGVPVEVVSYMRIARRAATIHARIAQSDTLEVNIVCQGANVRIRRPTVRLPMMTTGAKPLTGSVDNAHITSRIMASHETIRPV